MSKKFLNLDQFADPTRSVTLKGKEYTVRGMTVQRFIEAVQAEKDFDATGNDPVKQFEMAIKSIMIAIPDIPEADLRELTFAQLNMLVEFIRGELDEKAKGAEEGTEKNVTTE